MSKRCSVCLRVREPGHFWRRRQSPDGLDYWCKSCRRAWRMGYREIEREHDRVRTKTSAAHQLIGEEMGPVP